ncbi:MAG: tRNA uridine-5-carboxymethylaminomethyl(34) synthesis GTPase MnmE [Candidatus Zixiibacteriota bacterium]|nr:MAG: tRNA uridine-5-carboxymethylaminomethyl(34) synthesis GTPase MnmE [candidate division Zixibacteria bacterium]
MRSNTPDEETIAALATPRGVGAIAIVRLSGPRALEVAAGLVRRPDKLRACATHRLLPVDIVLEDGSTLDQALCAVFRRPHGYTGEDAAEIYLHGSPYIVDRTLERCFALGARPAQPGEFTLRAYLNGRFDLAQAEAVADLIAAGSETAHRTAMAQREGALSRRLGSLRERLTRLCGLLELEFDFSDQEAPLVEPTTLKEELTSVDGELQVLEASFTRGRLAREGAVVALAGAPNVGKSTLFNALLGEDRAIVDATPGTTRDAVEAVVEWDGLVLRLVDTAGQAGHFQGPDRQASDRARIAARAADAVLWVWDLTKGVDQDPPPPELADRTLLVGNKADLAFRPQIAAFPGLAVSALKGHGVEKVKEAILRLVLPDGGLQTADGPLTRERHCEAVRRARDDLSRGLAVIRDDRGQELLAQDLREAATHLGEILGEITPDDVLNRVFADFCIGK